MLYKNIDTIKLFICFNYYKSFYDDNKCIIYCYAGRVLVKQLVPLVSERCNRKSSFYLLNWYILFN